MDFGDFARLTDTKRHPRLTSERFTTESEISLGNRSRLRSKMDGRLDKRQEEAAEKKGHSRLRIIRWHAVVCPDGSVKGGHAWKKGLVERTGMPVATLSKLCESVPSKVVERPRSETLRTLGRKPDEEFFPALGFETEPTAPGRVEIQRLLNRLESCSGQEDYADVCLEYGITLLEQQRKDAIARRHDKVRRDADKEARWRTPSQACWRQSSDNPFGAAQLPMVPMHASEQRAMADVVSNLLAPSRGSGRSKSTATIVYARPYSGIAYALQRLLPKQPEFANGYRGGIYHLHMDALESGGRSKDVISQTLKGAPPSENKVPTSSEWSRLNEICRHILVNDQLLIIHGATNHSASDVKFLRELASRFEEISENQPDRQKSRLLITCWDYDLFSSFNNSKARRVDYRPEIETTSDILVYFRNCLSYYIDLRQKTTGLHIRMGKWTDKSFLKRVAHHYATHLHTDSPSAVRFRSFCASDFGAPSPFDPTQGIWKRVDDKLRERIPEIAACLGDVQSDIRAYGSRDKDRNVNSDSINSINGAPIKAELEKKAELRTLRFISTGLFFSTEQMIKNLRNNAVAAKYIDGCSFDCPDGLRKYFRTIRISDECDRRIATMPLLVRALIQDDWGRYDPDSRCAVHEGIADVLSVMTMQAESILASELPYSAPRGRYRLTGALETIRHCMRAAESAPPPKAIDLTKKAIKIYNDIFESNAFDATQGSQVAKHQVEPNYRVSRSFGLVGLKYEVLCLLSEDGRGFKPPRGLDNFSASAFFREMGVTLTRMVRPQEAIQFFDLALGIEGLGPQRKAYILAHRITACLLRGAFEDARRNLAEARSLEETIDLPPESVSAIISRNEAREAAIFLAEGDAEQSIKIWASLADNGLIEFWGDRAVGFLDSHLACSAAWDREQGRIWKVAEQACNKATNEGLDDERLRISIRRARIARLFGKPEVAEAILDQIGLELGRHGGSELVFREFQLESAVTLQTLGRVRYAFAAYAWPAFLTLSAGSANPWIEKARRLCSALLQEVEQFPGEELPDLDAHAFWKQSADNDRGLLEHPFFSMSILPPGEEVQKLFRRLAVPGFRNKYTEAL